jgi:hypothetical protein
VTFLLGTGPGILILTAVACCLTAGATMLTVTFALALLIATIRVIGLLRRS